MRVLINADDYGLTKSITDGIIDAHLNGIVHSATMMMNGTATDYAISLAKQHPSLKLGIHLVLTWGFPLTSNSGILNEDGGFKFTSSYEAAEAPDPKEVEKEWEAQIQAFLATGLKLHHIDSHHHVHGWKPLKEVVIHLAKKYRVPVRYAETLKDHHDILLTEALWTDFYADGVDELLFEKLAKLTVSSIEVMTHPSYIDDELRKVSSYTDTRKKELDLLTTLKMPDWAKPY